MSSMVCLGKRVLKKHVLDVSVGLMAAVILVTIVIPRGANADVDTSMVLPSDRMIALMVDSLQNQTREYGTLPEAENAEARRTLRIPITAYNSDPAQTDSTPCIAARGFDLCAHGEEDVVAANFLPIGTKLRIPELYGSRVFTVVDRMNARYHYRMDIWMHEKSDAKAFGMKYATVEVF